MKIFRDNKLYIQKMDIAYMNKTSISIPKYAFACTYGERQKKGEITKRFDFITIIDEKDIEYFMQLDFILDYDSYFNIPLSKLYDKYKILVNDIYKCEKQIKTAETQELDSASLITEYKNKFYMWQMILDISTVKNDTINFDFPTIEIANEASQIIAKDIIEYDKYLMGRFNYKVKTKRKKQNNILIE